MANLLYLDFAMDINNCELTTLENDIYIGKIYLPYFGDYISYGNNTFPTPIIHFKYMDECNILSEKNRMKLIIYIISIIENDTRLENGTFCNYISNFINILKEKKKCRMQVNIDRNIKHYDINMSAIVKIEYFDEYEQKWIRMNIVRENITIEKRKTSLSETFDLYYSYRLNDYLFNDIMKLWNIQ